MGIINVTPDSFSDGGQFLDHRRAIERGLQFVEQGAAVLDVGGESTRPFAEPVEAREELRRVLDVIQGLKEQTEVPISIDTSKAEVAREALGAGAEIINDVSGLTGDPRMLDVALEHQPGVCVMHMHGNPRTMQLDPQSHYDDVVHDIFTYLEERRQTLLSRGLDAARICLDPGIGFGKTHGHNLTLIASVARFHALGAPLLVGHSRKGFLAKILGNKDLDRTQATVGVSLALAAAGVQLLRVHDVQATREALLSFAAAGGIDGHPLSLEE